MAQNVYARVTPKTVKVTEHYFYKTILDENAAAIEQQNESQDQLQIAVEIPLDGHQYFTRTSASDIANQQFGTDTAARLGYIGLFWPESNPSRGSGPSMDGLTVNLSEISSEFDSSWSIVPIDLPLSDIPDDPYEWANDPTTYWIRQATAITLPVVPFQLKANVFTDPPSWLRMLNIKQPLDIAKQHIAEIVIAELTKPCSKENEMLIRLDILGSSEYCRTGTKLKCLKLAWPINTDGSDLQLFYEYYEPDLNSRNQLKEIPISYDPASNELSCHDLPIENDNAHIWLVVRNPAAIQHAIYQHGDVLHGSLEIITDNLLTKLQPVYFDAVGENDIERQTVNLKSHSNISISFELNLRYLFERQQFSTYQNLPLPGVAIDKERLEYIRTALSECGIKKEFEDESSNYKKHEAIWLFRGTKTIGGDELGIALLVKSTSREVERETDWGADSVRRIDTGGDTMIDIRGSYPQDVYRLNKEVSEIHSRIRERFEHLESIT